MKAITNNSGQTASITHKGHKYTLASGESMMVIDEAAAFWMRIHPFMSVADSLPPVPEPEPVAEVPKEEPIVKEIKKLKVIKHPKIKKVGIKKEVKKSTSKPVKKARRGRPRKK